MVMRQEVRGLTILTPELYADFTIGLTGGGSAQSVEIPFSLARNLAVVINGFHAAVDLGATAAAAQEQIRITLELDPDNTSSTFSGADTAAANRSYVAYVLYRSVIDVTNSWFDTETTPNAGYSWRGLSVIDRPINVDNVRVNATAPGTNDHNVRGLVAYQIVELSDELLTRFLRQRI